MEREMLRASAVLFLLVVAMTSAQARHHHRMYVTPQPASFNPQPNAVILCPAVAWSVPPDTKPGDITLGICPPRSMYQYPHPGQH
jgi:hypothetical protein